MKNQEQVCVEELLPFLRKPSRYGGNEFNVVKKKWRPGQVRLALVFPDLYEIGMSHQGLQILYRLVNSQEDYLAERAYAPDLDLENLLRQRATPLFSLESGRGLAEFDVVGITLPYELCFTNILTVLDLGRIPLRAADRNASHPLVLGGGSCSLNPEPVADFFDAILLGDGEEAILEILQAVKTGKDSGLARNEILNNLAGIAGVYVPSFFEPRYDQTGVLIEIRPLKAGYAKVRRRILADLETAAPPLPPLVPLTKIVHDRLGVEIARGCTRGCRFCQAGIIYRPVRERSPERVMAIARQGIAAGGFEELSLLSLSTGDYACLPAVLGQLMDEFAERKVAVAVPSMRVGTLTPAIMGQIQRVSKTGFTVAPEAGTDRLRRVINKGITEEDLLATCRAAFGLGWRLLKFYFMFGLPTETAEDVEAIVGLARRALQEADAGGQGRQGCQINISVATFVPKAHTPFQWEEQISIDAGFASLDRLKKILPRRGFKLKWHDPRQSFLEGVFARGDRRLAAVIRTAWQQGARLDGWSEHYNLENWLAAGRACGLDLAGYLRRRQPEEVLPWQHLDPGVDQAFIKNELARARQEEYTPDCRVHGCQNCGLCDFKTIRPVVYRFPDRGAAPAPVAACVARKVGPPAAAPQAHYLYRLNYSRRGAARFIGHLELIQAIFRALRRADLKLNFSQGYNPTPRVAFSPALPVGTESLAEYIEVDLATGPIEPAALAVRLNRQLPAGLAIDAVERVSAGPPARIETCYHIALTPPPAREKLDDFTRAVSFVISRTRKGKKAPLDIRPQISKLSLTADGQVELVMASAPGQAGCKPLELLKAVLDLSDHQVLTARVLKVWWQGMG